MSRIPNGGMLFNSPKQIAFQPIMLPPDQLLLHVAAQQPATMTPREAVGRSVELAAEVVLAVERGDIISAVERLKIAPKTA